MRMKRLLLFVSLALIFVSCKKENEAPKIGSTLQVENLATTQTPLAVLEKTALTDESLNKQELLKNLQSNPNIETATYSEDKYLIIKEKSNKIISVFPSISTGSLEDIGNREAGSLKFRSLKAAGSAGKVAIFNYFDGYGGLGRDGQNKIVEDLVYLFEQHDYQVDYYNYERFTRSNVSKVVGQSEKYAAIIVMSHGFVNTSQGRTIAYYALGEKYDDRRDTPWEYNYNPFADTYQERKDPRPWYYRLWSGSEYNAVDEVNSLATARNCILYIGACEAFKKGATSRYASSPQTYIGWDDVNKYSQAHAGLLFNRMLQDEMSLEAALSTLWKSEDTGAKLVYGGNTEIRLKSKQSEVRNSIRQVHFKDLSRGLNGTEVFFKKFSTFLSGHYTYTLEGSLDPQYAPKYLYVALKPISRFSKTHLFNKIKIKKDGTFKKKILIPNNLRGIYNLIAGANKDLSDVISISPPKSFIYSTSFQENSAQVLSLFDGNSIEVSINGEEVQSVSLSQGEEQSLVIEEYEDYHYSISVDKPALLDAQISSMNILLRGKAEGQATLTIRCKETGGQTILPIIIGQEAQNRNWTPLDKVYEYDGDDNHHRYKLYSRSEIDWKRAMTWYQFAAIGLIKWQDGTDLTMSVDPEFNGNIRDILYDLFHEGQATYLVMYKNEDKRFAIKREYVKHPQYQIWGLQVKSINISHIKHYNNETIVQLPWDKATERFFPCSGLSMEMKEHPHPLHYGESLISLYWIDLGWMGHWRDEVFNDESTGGKFFSDYFVNGAPSIAYSYLNKAAVRYHY